MKQAIIDTGAHHALIGKGLAKQLNLDLPGRLIERGILLTVKGGQPKWMPRTKRPIEVVVLPGTEKECCIQLQCGVSDSEDYDVLVGMELLYRVGATICTWQEKVLYHVQYWDPESAVGTLPMKFVKQEPWEAYQAQKKDPRGATFRDLKRVLEMIQKKQGEVLYILENVDLAKDRREPVRQAFEEIVEVLGRGVPADAAQLGSRAHRPRREHEAAAQHRRVLEEMEERYEERVEEGYAYLAMPEEVGEREEGKQTDAAEKKGETERKPEDEWQMGEGLRGTTA
ncbi:unnamed protein product, partial [Closterium sp. NIES-54]